MYYIVIDFRPKNSTNTRQKSSGRCVTIRLVDNFMGPTMCVALFIKKLFAKAVETRPGQPGRHHGLAGLAGQAGRGPELGKTERRP